jgi:hypothetical protein
MPQEVDIDSNSIDLGYIPIANPIDDIRKLKKPTNITIPKGEIDVLFEYPLTNKVIKTFYADTTDGFTKAGLINMICDFYEEIYDEEEKTTTTKSGNIPNMIKKIINFFRNITDGRYGIWGHDITDLYLHTIRYDPDYDFYILGIDS